MSNPIPLWIDTDPGHDDAMALLLLAKNPTVNILGVSTVAGNVPLPEATRNARFMLRAAGRNDVCVYAGKDRPLVRDQVLADVHGATGLDGLVLEPASPPRVHEALPQLAAVLTRATEPVTILALGPLTNIAYLLTEAPQLASAIAQIVIMGGAIAAPGNKSRVAEFNIFCDPEAAAIVFDFPVPKTLVPLDPCNNVILVERDITRFADNRVGTMLRQMLKPYIENICRFEGVRGALMYDPIAAFFLLEPNAFTVMPMDVRVEVCAEGLTYGMTVAERRALAKVEINMNVVTALDGERFIDRFIHAMNTYTE